MICCMNQRSGFNNAKGKTRSAVSSVACLVSIGFHVILLIVFGLIRFSHSPLPENVSNPPQTSLNRINKLLDRDIVIPKPKVKPLTSSLANKTVLSLPGEKPILARPNQSGLANNFSKDSAELVSYGDFFSRTVEFFGCASDERKICYVVDCSGSMTGLFNRAKTELKESITDFRQDQFFSIIFFGQELFEFSDGKFTRATNKSKSAVKCFIDSISPKGTAEATAAEALKKAMQIRDSRGNYPAVIYFLTDGSDLNGENRNFTDQVITLRKQLAPKVKIYTVGFWAQPGDREQLNQIANQTGAEFVLVCDEKSNESD